MHYRFELCLPELYLLLVGVILLAQSMFFQDPKKGGSTVWVAWAAGAGVIIAALSLGDEGMLFWESYRVDQLSQYFKLAVATGLFITILNALGSSTVKGKHGPDYCFFLVMSAWGLMLLASAVELITIYICMEISSYSLYAIIPLRSNDKGAAEAGIKYILFGAVATAIALYGYSYILGTMHTSYIADLAGMDWSWSTSPMAIVGLGLFLCGLLFKLALFPFHFWCPDVYQGTSNETAAFVAVMPKLGAVAVLVRLGGLLEPSMELTNSLAIFGAVSMTLGNLAALAQRDLKRMLGYSSVAHAGYIMLGIVSGSVAGLGAAAFYSVVYLLMNLACFWVICRLAPDGRNLRYDDLNGLSWRRPVLAFVLAVAAFALVGLPPTAGFMGKLFLLKSAWANGYQWLVIVAVLNTALAIYYYLSLVRHAYTKGEETFTPQRQTWSASDAFGMVLAISILFLGILPGWLYSLALETGNGLAQ